MTIKSIRDTVWEYVKVIGGALIIASSIRAVAYEPFKIPSASMVPTLLIGDFLFVNKHVYGFRNPCTGERTEGEPIKRGDVVVFEVQKGAGCGMLMGLGAINYIKRVVGLPGDRIRYENRRLYINDEPMPLLENGTYQHLDHKGNALVARHLIEKLNGVQHSVLWLEERFSPDMQEVVVPEGKYIVMGDNRDNSKDSRYGPFSGHVGDQSSLEFTGEWGFVDDADIVGRADMLFWSVATGLRPRWDRIGGSLRPELSGE